MEPKPTNKRLILNSAKAVSTLKTAAGVEVETEYYLAPILHCDLDSDYYKGQIVCVLKNRITKIPVNNSWEYSCFETDTFYTLDSEQDPKDKNV
jgi:hypothetical protein